MGSIDSSAEISRIIQQLTLAEKVSLLSAKDWWRTPSIERDDIYVPHIKTTDGPNGARGESYVSGIKAACFPCATNLGASFDVELLYRLGQEIAGEAKSKSASVLLAPTLNVIRSPLGGRTYETYSEDPVVLGQLAAAFVNGCQSINIAATPKHFVANDAENQRTTLSVEIDEQTLRELYLYPFQLVMKLSQPLCFMTSYNRVNGVYVADDRRLIDDVLRKEWGFSGLVISDWMGTYSTADSLNAGMDLEMPGPSKMRGKLLLDAVEDGSVIEKTINQSARRVLELAKALGRFEEPREEPPEHALDNPERDIFIRNAAAEGMVLLKNDNKTLPLEKGASVAVIGHFAIVASLGGGGSARVDALRAITPLQGLETIGVECRSSPGVPVFGALPHADPSIISKPNQKTFPDAPNRFINLQWFNSSCIGQDLAHTEMIQNAEYMIKEAWPQYLNTNYCSKMSFELIPKTSGPHGFSIISTGRAICSIDGKEVFVREQEQDLKIESFYFFKSKLERRFTFNMIAGQKYSISLDSWATDPEILNSAPLFGKMFQGSSLRFFEHVDIPQAISTAAEIAAKTDYAVVCVGTTNEVESEGYDRDTMDLPGRQYDLIKAIAQQNPRTIIVNFSGSPVTMDFAKDVPAILQAWFPGQECGHSVAQVLTGMINPSGRLPMSWPRKVEDNPSFVNFPAENNVINYAEGLDIGYRYYDRKSTPTPLFNFGFGLSYTTFEISDSQAPKNTIRAASDCIEIICRVKNIGSLQGKCVVQFYVQMPNTTLGRLRPMKELKAFTKKEIMAGQEEVAKVTLDKDSVSIYDADHACWRALKGTHIVHIGLSSDNISETLNFCVEEEFTWTGV